ncbi:hypothetical protein [Streptomyces sp. NPDC007205]|uniref:hypothetical protein n=1 Tax=Streptomyces sp. NPDC007205 TaxID=3154316 RepID=UPI0033FDADE1
MAGRLVVLGAGNCNDLDLAEVASVFREVHLVDIDSDAVQRGVERQRMGSAPVLRVHGGVDVTRMLQDCPSGVESADVVVSAGVMSQLINGAASEGLEAAGLLRVRDAHLQTMMGLLRQGGRGVLVDDVVSSDTCPQLPATPQDQLPLLLSRLLEERNFFTGCNPFAIAQKLAMPPLRATGQAVSPPWRWDIGTRSYLVCAVSFRRDTL